MYTDEPFWVIEMQGPSYLAARCLGGYEFYWDDDIHKAVKFFDRTTADTVMMAVRQLRGDLFPACLSRVPVRRRAQVAGVGPSADANLTAAP